jgi:hypothetical protein
VPDRFRYRLLQKLTREIIVIQRQQIAGMTAWQKQYPGATTLRMRLLAHAWREVGRSSTSTAARVEEVDVRRVEGFP